MTFFNATVSMSEFVLGISYNVLGVGTMTIQNFKDLDAWKIGHEFVLEIYNVTKNFPKDEIFGLTNQVRRAAVSVTSNIAEGFSRNSSKEKCQFYSMSLGSLTECQNQITIATDIGYLDTGDFDKICETTVRLHKMINGLLKSATSRNT